MASTARIVMLRSVGVDAGILEASTAKVGVSAVVAHTTSKVSVLAVTMVVAGIHEASTAGVGAAWLKVLRMSGCRDTRGFNGNHSRSDGDGGTEISRNT